MIDLNLNQLQKIETVLNGKNYMTTYSIFASFEKARAYVRIHRTYCVGEMLSMTDEKALRILTCDLNSYIKFISQDKFINVIKISEE